MPKAIPSQLCTYLSPKLPMTFKKLMKAQMPLIIPRVAQKRFLESIDVGPKSTELSHFLLRFGIWEGLRRK